MTTHSKIYVWDEATRLSPRGTHSIYAYSDNEVEVAVLMTGLEAGN